MLFMKKTIFKKFMAVTTIAIMTLGATSMVSFADTSTPTSGVTDGLTYTESFDIQLTKDIIAYNDEDITVYSPIITYDYSVAPADTTGMTISGVTVTSGVAGGVTMGTDKTAVFTADGSAGLTSGKGTFSDTFVITVDPEKFTDKGIYRYVLTEDLASGNDFTVSGITRPSNYEETRYIDIYVTANQTVTSYVISVPDETDGKTTGFSEKEITETTVGEGGQQITNVKKFTDEYYTFNYTVKKVITGMSSKTEKFPFTVTLTGLKSGSKFTVGGDAVTNTTITKDLGNNDTIVIKGLPANTLLEVSESNSTQATYSTSIEGGAGLVFSDTSGKLTPGSTAGFTAQAISTYVNSNTANVANSLTDATFTNDIETISPTGVVLMVGPYFIMFGTAVFLITFFFKRRRTGEESAEAVI